MLTEVQCRSAKAADKPVKLADSLGVHFFITLTVRRVGQCKYRFGQQRRIVFRPCSNERVPFRDKNRLAG
jgi:hypothetical protein